MKKTIFVLVLISASCTFTKEQKAQKLIKGYLDSNLNDPHSYESVSIKIDTFWNNAMSDVKYSKLFDSSMAVSFKIRDVNQDIFWGHGSRIANAKLKKSLLQDSISLEKQLKAIGDTIINRPNGWVITQTYRAKNGFGALGLHSIVVHSDKNINAIIDVMSNR